MSDDQSSSGRVGVAAAELPSLHGLLTLAIGVVVVAALYLARDVLVPATLAVLLSFVLAPFVRLLRSLRLPRPPAVLIAVLLALTVILGIGGVIGTQIASLVQDLPRYETTIRQKVDAVHAVTIGQVNRILQRFEEMRGDRTPGGPARAPAAGQSTRGRTAPPAPNASAPAPGNASTGTASESPFALLQTFVSPVLSPVATLGIVLVITLFILLQQDDLRDRFIRLVGARDLHRTTVALNDAVRRLSKYFLAQLALNSAFGVFVAVSLFFIGLPSPILWGLVAGLLRFIPYVGAWVAAALPLVVAAAVDPGWSMFAWTLALFVITEPIMGQVVEPFVYGRSTGLTPVSVVFATIFWTWLWGPIGLILATPLTLCLVVLGRHVDRLEFLDVLLGDRPALSPAESFYQRMLASDPDEVQDQAEVLLRTRALSSYYDEVALPGLRLAADDALRGALNTPQLRQIRDSVQDLVQELDDYDDAKPAATVAGGQTLVPSLAGDQPGDDPAPVPPSLDSRPASGLKVLCVAGASPLDEAACAMLAQLLAKHGLTADRLANDRSSRLAIATLDRAAIAMVCVSAIETSGSIGRLRLLVRRLRRQLPNTPILLGLWPRDESPTDIDVVAEIEADRRVTSLVQATRSCVEAVKSRAAAPDLESAPAESGRMLA